jgi:succinoglycan biosynthesis protein ExoM
MTRTVTRKQKIGMAETKHSSGGAGADGLETGGTVIAVLTYRRPEDIALALPRLGVQAMSGDGGRSPDGRPATVLVVDNDPEASARPIVEQLAGTLPPGLVRYVHEPKPGIAAARNRALAEAAASDLLVFIDDDETPSEHWLAQLVELQRSTGAAAVVGPVISEYEHEPEPWIEAGRFFRRRRLASGSRLDVAATNNLLLDLHQIRAMQLHFDERFGLSGGSDTLFTRQLVQRGGAMLWCDEAVVVDRVPAARLTRGWVLRRALRSGNSATRVSLELADSSRTRLAARGASLASGTVRLLGGSARAAAGLVTGSVAQRATGMRTAARGLGMSAGAFGYVYSEYRRK